MDLVNAVLNFVVPPASMIIVAFAWPTISFLHALEWFFKTLYRENMENKVVLITGASSAIGEAAKAAVVNFYETLRFELKDDVGITIAAHGWTGSDVSRGRFVLEEGAEMQWKEEREVPLAGGHVEEFAKLMVADACRGYAYAKHPSWCDVFLLYRVFAPDILGWAFRLLLSNDDGAEPTSGRRFLEASSPRKPIAAFSSASPRRPSEAE